MFRLRMPDTHKPLLISNQIILDYAQDCVETLYTKNLLHLGQDRYLTTLLLKHSSRNMPLSVGHMRPMSDIGLLSQPGQAAHDIP